MDILKQVTIYTKFKGILDKVNNANSEVGNAMRCVLTIEQIETMAQYVKDCEDMGLHLIAPKIKN